MASIKSKMTSEFRTALEETVQTTVSQTIHAMFGCQMEMSGKAISGGNDMVVSSVEFRQGVETITLRLVFERQFIYSLVFGYYDREAKSMENDDICTDAACELANIIFHKVKFFMNSHGFLFYMELPAAGDSSSYSPGNDDIIQVSFRAPDHKEATGAEVLCVNIA